MLRKLCLVVLVCFVCCGVAQADPWPNYFAHDRVVDYAEVTASFDGTTWYYSLKVDAGAVDPMYGPVQGILGLGVYPNPALGPGDPGFEDIVPISFTALWPEWREGPWSNKAFGYISERGPSTYILPGQEGVVGTAMLIEGFDPGPTQGYILHIATINTDEWGNEIVDTFWARPVPEPSGLLVGASGLAALAGMIRRRMGQR